MIDPKQQPPSERKPATEVPQPKKAAEKDRANADPPADDSIEGEGSPGLTITGGGGHA
jgi:hypothetical protein